MAKPKETFNKKEKEKKRLKQKQEKQEKMAERKAHSKKGKSLEDMMAYIDENGNISDTPPDPRRKVTFKTEDIQIGVPKMEDIPDVPRTGVVSFFNDAKGFGFINEQPSGERIFVHINQLTEPIREGDKVTYEVERGPRGLNATEVRKLQ
ncbi:MAG: cold shock domain-containing protein [Chitinophagaceae bacterium]|jgi:cold shock CspA family protein|nr:cold shock domain-containing protein [Chitinophagaceae bacterium]